MFNGAGDATDRRTNPVEIVSPIAGKSVNVFGSWREKTRIEACDLGILRIGKSVYGKKSEFVLDMFERFVVDSPVVGVQIFRNRIRQLVFLAWNPFGNYLNIVP